jgi:uroporphyrinogen III methyltransferase/synthase
MGTGRGGPVKQGTVYIVGAGPGDPELITVRGLACIREADVILHDRLVDRRLLDEVRHEAEVIDVGKEHGNENAQQEWIHEVMIDRASRGKVVCRLKGGDPFVFGRGGEEIHALKSAGISWEVVPGVSSAIAAPAAADIPVTHRDFTHSFMVIAGNRSTDLDSEEWIAAKSLVAAGGTLIVLMGLARLPLIVSNLLSGGCAGSVPVAVISRGTRPDQVSRIGTLADIKTRVGDLKSPATIVIGNVVSLGQASAVQYQGLAADQDR